MLYGLPMIPVVGKRPLNAGWYAAAPLLGPLPKGADGVAVRLGMWGDDALYAVNTDATIYAPSITLATPGKMIAVWRTPSGGSTALYVGRHLPPLNVKGAHFNVMTQGTIAVAPPTPGYTLIPRRVDASGREFTGTEAEWQALKRAADPGEWYPTIDGLD
jgi:hypothetical protein